MIDGRLKVISNVRDEISRRQVNEIKQLYRGVLRSLYREEKSLLASGVSSESMRIQQIHQLRATTEKLLKQVSNSVYNLSVSGITQMVDSTLDIYDMSTAIKQGIVAGFVTGSIYGGDWSLSSAIWGSNQRQLRDIYRIVARGQLLGLSVEDIAKQLQKYVNPDVYYGNSSELDVYVSNHKIDYNATRLVRTLTTHAYQYAEWLVTYQDPNVIGYRWHAAGPRACPICRARDGVVFQKDNVPWDHPNGMCYIEPVYSDTSVLNEFIGYADDAFMKDFIWSYVDRLQK